MPINPITLDKLEPVTIRHMESRLVDKIVHEIKGAQIQQDNKNNSNSNNGSFNQERQEKSAQQFGYFLSKFNIKFEYRVLKNKIKIKIKDKDDNILIETETEDIENLLNNIKRETGSIIDMRG